MINKELVLNMLAELSTKEISEAHDLKTLTNMRKLPGGVVRSLVRPVNGWRVKPVSLLHRY